MIRNGNIRFTRRIVAFVGLLIVAVSLLMRCQSVYADSISGTSVLTFRTHDYYDGKESFRDVDVSMKYSCASPVYSFIYENITPSGDLNKHDFYYGFMSTSNISFDDGHFGSSFVKDGVYFYVAYWPMDDNHKLASSKSDIFLLSDCGTDEAYTKLAKYLTTGEKSDGMIIGGSGYMPNTQAYSEIGCLDNVQMETYITNKKELDFADENADLAKINQDKVIVYSSSTTTGIDLSKGGYKVQLYGSYAWQDKSGNIKSEDKGHKTFIKDWYAENNIKGLNRSKYTWIDWKSANDKVEADKTDKAHKPNAFEKMTTYANYQYEPIWYLRIVSKDNKYGAWVKLYNSSSKKGNYDSDSVDDDDNKVSDSEGGYDKTKSTSEITGTGDTPEDAKNNVQKAEEKQDNKDIQDASGGSNSTFDKLEEFTKGIGDVPKMIADIFSFLPSWCLEVVAIGFALLMILIVVKFIRG